MILAALSEWSRKSELSADRAGLLATQDPAVAFRVHMKLASGSGDLSELDQTSFFAQGQEYLDAGDLRDSVLKLLLVERRTHPYAVVRAAELRRWVDSGEYTAILSGDYPRREDDADASMSPTRPRRPPTPTPRCSARRRTPSASWSTTSRVSPAVPRSGSTRSSAVAAPTETCSSRDRRIALAMLRARRGGAQATWTRPNRAVRGC